MSGSGCMYQARRNNLAKLLADSKKSMEVVRDIATRVTQLKRCLDYTKGIKENFETERMEISAETAQDVIIRLETVHRNYGQRQQQYQREYTKLIAEQNEVEAVLDDIRYAAICEARGLAENDTFRNIAATIEHTKEISDKNRADLKFAQQKHGLEG